MSKEKEVITISGETKPISKCRKFDNGYYAIGDLKVERSGDCYFIGNKYFRVETGQVLYDHEIGQHVLKSESLTHGVISISDKGVVFGHFSMNPLKNVVIRLENGMESYLINYELLEGQKQFRERLSDGKFYHIKALNATQFNEIITPSNNYKTSLSYDSGPVLEQYVETYNELDVEISKNVSDYASLLGDLSFGLEFETTAGFLPNRILSKTGLIPLRDGSISGIEYVTVPLIGAKGFQTVINATKELKDRTIYDDSCALHMHIGNVPRTPEFLLALLKVTCATQDEIYSMFPLYKKYNFGVKNKNYSKPYPAYQLMSQLDPIITKSNIDANFNVLYSYLSMGESFQDRDCDLKNVQTHPADRDARAKWNITTRYYLNNMIPLIFGNKQTIEFRIHTPTLEVNKIIPFMLMNISLISFTIKNCKQILENPRFATDKRRMNIQSIVFDHVQSTTLRSSHLRDSFLNMMNTYFQNRKDKTAAHNRSGNILGDEKTINGPRGIDWYSYKKPQEVKESEENVTLDTSVANNLSRRELEQAIMNAKDQIRDLHQKGAVSTQKARDITDSLNSTYASRRASLMGIGEW